MYIYGPQHILPERIKQAEQILNQIKTKQAFISGSFLFKQEYNDIDLFLITRSKKKLSLPEKVKVNYIDFNDLYSLFYHSITQICVSKNILIHRPLKTTIVHYWNIINETVPEYLNYQNSKQLRSLILHTEYYKNNHVLNPKELYHKTNLIKEPLRYIREEVPKIIKSKCKKSYLKRFIYTQAGFYKEHEYDAQKYLYQLTHLITHGIK
jgi:hypothetical protein